MKKTYLKEIKIICKKFKISWKHHHKDQKLRLNMTRKLKVKIYWKINNSAFHLMKIYEKVYNAQKSFKKKVQLFKKI